VAGIAPDRLLERVQSITLQDSAETRDTSAAARLQSWRTATEIAVNHPLFGEGFRALWIREIWESFYGQGYLAVQDAHSIYFEVLGEHGFLGLGLYLLLLANTMLTLGRVRRRWRGDAQHAYLAGYAEMTQTALYPYLAAGAFLGVAYFDLYFLLVATSAILAALSAKAEAGAAESSEPVPVAPLPAGSGLAPLTGRRPRIRGNPTHA
jgi:probable O-glycosylation ligase (exosortase A-associated)